jgi:hypothetical protein
MRHTPRPKSDPPRSSIKRLASGSLPLKGALARFLSEGTNQWDTSYNVSSESDASPRAQERLIS